MIIKIGSIEEMCDLMCDNRIPEVDDDIHIDDDSSDMRVDNRDRRDSGMGVGTDAEGA